MSFEYENFIQQLSAKTSPPGAWADVQFNSYLAGQVGYF